MALIYPVQYELNFDTIAGSDIEWTLEILRGYEEGTTPTWFEGGLPPAVRPLTGTSEPIIIDAQKDYTVNKPIQGTTGRINLIVEREGQYNDFASGSRYEWRVRLRKTGSSTPYFEGFIDPVDSDEQINTFPFKVSYTIIDGLGKLGEATIPGIENTTAGIYSGTDNVSLLSVIQYVLEQTGLDYDLYIDSGIESPTGDAIITAMVDPYSFYQDTDRTMRDTRKEALEDSLASFGCKVTQANGRWYIYNGSSHKDTTTWKVFNSERVAQPDVTESLVKTVGNGDLVDLIPAKSDLKRPLRTPVGSVECSPKMVERQIETNGGFELGTEGWLGGVDPIVVQSAIRYAGQNAIVTNRTTRAWEMEGDTWVVNEAGYPVSTEGDIDISMDMLGVIHLDDTDLGARNIQVGYQVYFIPDTPNIVGSLNVTGFGVPFAFNQTVVAYYYDFVNNEWMPYFGNFKRGTDQATDLGGKLADTTRNFIIEEGALNQWVSEKVTVNAPREYFDYGGSDGNAWEDIPTGRMFIRVFYPRSNRPKGHGKNSFTRGNLTTLTTYLDNIRIRNDFGSDITEPVFERIQNEHSQTLTYEPKFASSTNEFLVQTLDEKSYKRSGVTENKTLEEIVTQQIFNDRGRPFKYYTGTLINNSTNPLTNIDKPKVNYSWTQDGSTNTFIEPFAGIMNGGEFRVKSNMFKADFYIPNQSEDLSPINRGDVDSADYSSDGVLLPGYYTQNIDLLPAPFPGRSDKISYTLGFDITTTDENSEVVADGLTVSGGRSFIHLTGEPGTVQDYRLTLIPAAGYVGVSGSTSIAPDTRSDDGEPGATPLPVFAEAGDFYSDGGSVGMIITITFPEQSEFETFHINGSVLNFVPEEAPDAVTASIVVTNNIAGTETPTTTTIPATGRPGDIKNIVYQVDAGSGRIVLNPDETHGDTSLSDAIVTGSGSQVATFTFEYSVPTTPESVAVTVTGTSATETDFELNGITKNLVITNNILNTSIVDGNEDTVVFHGFDGDVVSRNITILPNPNYYITSAPNPSYGVGVVSAGTVHRSGEDWEIPVDVTISDTDSTMTINGSSALEENEIIFNVVPRGNSNMTISTDSDIRQTFSSQQFGEDISPTIITLTPDEGFSYEDTSGIQVDINEAKVRLADGSNLMLPESQFSPTITLNGLGNVEISINGDFPALSGIFTIDVNIQGGLETIPVLMNVVDDAVTENMDTSVMTNSVRFQTGSSLQPYVYQYVDGDGQTRVNQIFTPDAVDICVAGDDIAASLANASWNSNPGGDGVITTGSGTCNIGTINSDTVNGVMLQVSSTPPSSGTASNVITFVTS